MERFDQLVSKLRLPAVAAPMTFVSTPELVGEACRAGIVGSFPTSNASSIAQLDEWFEQIETHRSNDSTNDTGTQDGAQRPPGPVAANLIVGKQNKRLDDDVAAVAKWQPELVITSVGSPAPVVGPLHESGCIVLADIASEAHAHKALAAGVDGLVLLSAGAGGHTGWANPFAFASAVRSFFDGPMVVAGGMSDGGALWAANCAGYDLGLFGTRFIATDEAATTPGWQAALERSTMDNVSLATAPNGVVASVLPDNAGSAGHTVSAVRSRQPVATVVDEIEASWQAARARTRRFLGADS